MTYLNDVNEQKLDHEEFNELQMMLDWFNCEWGDEHDPIPNDVIEYEEDYELKSINQPTGLSSTEV